MAGLELLGVILVALAIIEAFRQKNDKLGFALILVLLILLFMLGYI